MKVIVAIFAIVVLSLSAYSLITGEYGLLSHTQLLIGIMLLVLGITQIQEKRKGTGIYLFLCSGFILFVGVYVLLT